MEFTLRDATTDDTSAVSVVRRAVAGIDTDRYEPEQLAAWADAASPDKLPIEDPETDFLVADAEDSTVGLAFGKSTPDDYFDVTVDAEITGVYVLPERTGIGVGSRLCDELERRFADASAGSVGLWASLNAVGFYEGRGYEALAEHVVEYDDVTLPVLEMRKPLE